jgi:hypothetical protein
MQVMPRRHFGHNFGALLLALTVGLGLSVGPKSHGFREDEVECEETFAHLLECCERTELANVDCLYHEGCDFAEYPDITPAEGRCLRKLSCSQIRAANVCAQLSERKEDTFTPLGVCP